MKRRGFTLIELLAAMSIFLIILLINFKGILYYKNHIERIEGISTVYEVKEFLGICKRFCYENQKNGEIYFDNCDEFKKVHLICQGKVVETHYIENKVKLMNSNCVKDNKRIVLLKVNEKGYIDPFTLKIKDGESLEKKIVIQVGGNLIYIKDEE